MTTFTEAALQVTVPVTLSLTDLDDLMWYARLHQHQKSIDSLNELQVLIEETGADAVIQHMGLQDAIAMVHLLEDVRTARYTE